MSEYSYYEFQAIEQTLTKADIAELRRCSTRAKITSTSFTNEYSWGDFKGDAQAWIEQYFDAYIHFSDYGSRQLMLRLPLDVLSLETVEAFECEYSLVTWESDSHLILSFWREYSDGDYEESVWGCEEACAAMASVRADLMAGDTRLLYLVWLSGVQSLALEYDESEWDDNDNSEHAEFLDSPEPPLPAGLQELGPELQAFVEFFDLDRDLLSAAAEASPPLTTSALSDDALSTAIAELDEAEKQRLLMLVAQGKGAEARATLLKQARANIPGIATTSRSVASLITNARLLREQREQKELERSQRKQAQEAARIAQARAKHLDRLAKDEDAAWLRVDALIAERKPKPYDTCVELLRDLLEIATNDGRAEQASARVASLRFRHDRKQTFIDRLNAAGII